MAEHDWYLFEGSPRNIAALYKTLATNAHYLVSGPKTALYLRIQHSEVPFVSGISKSHGVSSKLTDQPVFEQAPCGKNTLDANQHGKACKGCRRLRANDENARASEIQRTAITREEFDERSVAPEFSPATRSPDGKYKSGVGSMMPGNPLIPPPSKSAQRRQEALEWREKAGGVTTYSGSLAPASSDTLSLPDVSVPVVKEGIEVGATATVAKASPLPAVENLTDDAAPSQPADGPSVEWLNDMAHYYMAISFKYERLAELVALLSDAKELKTAAEKQYEDTRKALLEGV
jgi:hypothetical protein